jgi:hypothetical protein
MEGWVVFIMGVKRLRNGNGVEPIWTASQADKCSSVALPY